MVMRQNETGKAIRLVGVLGVVHQHLQPDIPSALAILSYADAVYVCQNVCVCVCVSAVLCACNC